MTIPANQRYALIGGVLIPIGVMASGVRILPHRVIESFMGMRKHTQATYAAEPKK